MGGCRGPPTGGPTRGKGLDVLGSGEGWADVVWQKPPASREDQFVHFNVSVRLFPFRDT